MLMEAYMTALFICVEYGRQMGFLLISIISSICVFPIVVLTSWAFKKKEKELNWLAKLVLVELYFMIAWILLLFISGIPLQAFTIPLSYATAIYFLLVLPLTKVYNYLMKNYPELPWHFTQYLLCLAASLIFWAVIIFYFDLFAIADTIVMS